jgi:type II secretory pathway component PulF
MLRSISLSHFCQVLALLVRLEIPLSRALHAAGQTAGDSDLAFGADKLATAAEHGTPLAERARPLFQFPEGLLQTFRWERDQELLVTGLEAYGELYAQQAETYSGMIRSVGQPVIIILLAGVLMYYMTIVPFFMPVIKLLNDLS